MQQWLDAGWSEEDINKVVDYAFRTDVDTVKHGPQTLKRKFKKLAQQAIAPTKEEVFPEQGGDSTPKNTPDSKADHAHAN